VAPEDRVAGDVRRTMADARDRELVQGFFDRVWSGGELDALPEFIDPRGLLNFGVLRDMDAVRWIVSLWPRRFPT
jgi:hypothetical protein